jgi:transcription antitermination factor NusG
MSWFALRAAPSREFKAEIEIKKAHLKIEVPREYKKRKRYSGRRRPDMDKPIVRPVYGSWIFVGFPRGFDHEFVKHLMERELIIGYAVDADGRPCAISPSEIIEIRRNDKKLEDLVMSEELPFKVGQEVKIVDGPFHGFPLTISEITEEHRARGDVELFGRPTPIELEFDQLEAVG